VIVDLQGRIVDLNDEVVRSYGWTRDDLLDQPVSQMVPRADHRLLEERLDQCRKGETIRRVDKSGREHKGLLTLSLLTDERGALERSP
jgi:PAS domain S-box-containing protein